MAEKKETCLKRPTVFGPSIQLGTDSYFFFFLGSFSIASDSARRPFRRRRRRIRRGRDPRTPAADLRGLGRRGRLSAQRPAVIVSTNQPTSQRAKVERTDPAKRKIRKKRKEGTSKTEKRLISRLTFRFRFAAAAAAPVLCPWKDEETRRRKAKKKALFPFLFSPSSSFPRMARNWSLAALLLFFVYFIRERGRKEKSSLFLRGNVRRGGGEGRRVSLSEIRPAGAAPSVGG